MVKMKLLTVTLIVALILTGTAYASWTQTINLEATVETGILSVGVSASTSAYVSEEWSDETLVFNPTSIVVTNDNNVTFTGLNFFPGAVQVTEVLLVNTGTIPADIMIKNIVENMPRFMDYTVDIYTSANEVTTYSGSSLDIVDGKYETLNVGESMRVKITATFSGDNTEADMRENTEYTYSFIFDVSQFNYDNN